MSAIAAAARCGAAGCGAGGCRTLPQAIAALCAVAVALYITTSRISKQSQIIKKAPYGARSGKWIERNAPSNDKRWAPLRHQWCKHHHK